MYRFVCESILEYNNCVTTEEVLSEIKNILKQDNIKAEEEEEEDNIIVIIFKLSYCMEDEDPTKNVWFYKSSKPLKRMNF